MVLTLVVLPLALPGSVALERIAGGADLDCAGRLRGMPGERLAEERFRFRLADATGARAELESETPWIHAPGTLLGDAYSRFRGVLTRADGSASALRATWVAGEWVAPAGAPLRLVLAGDAEGTPLAAEILFLPVPAPCAAGVAAFRWMEVCAGNPRAQPPQGLCAPVAWEVDAAALVHYNGPALARVEVGAAPVTFAGVGHGWSVPGVLAATPGP